MDLESEEECRKRVSAMMSGWSGEYEELLKQAQKIEVETKKIRAVQRKLDDGLYEFGKVEKEMASVWEAYKQGLRDRMSDLEEIFSVLKRQGLRPNETKHKVLTNRITDLEETAARIRPWEGDMKVSLLEKEALSIQTEASGILPVSSDETVVLQSVVEEKRLSNRDWISLQELENLVRKKDKRIDVREVVDGLLKKRILRPGFSFVGT